MATIFASMLARCDLGSLTRTATALGVAVMMAVPVVVLPVIVWPVMAMEAPIKIQGSTTFNSEVLILHRASIEKATGRKLSIVANKSSWGLLALAEMRADIAMISAPLDAEIQAARKQGEDVVFDDLRSHLIAKTRVTFITHPSNPIKSLPLQVVGRILKGEITNWREVNGPDLPILVVATKDGGGTVVAVRTNILGDAPFAPSAVRLESAQHVFTAVSQEPRAIGIAQWRLARQLNAHELDTDVRVEQPLSFVTRGEPTADASALIAATRMIVRDDND